MDTGAKFLLRNFDREIDNYYLRAPNDEQIDRIRDLRREILDSPLSITIKDLTDYYQSVNAFSKSQVRRYFHILIEGVEAL